MSTLKSTFARPPFIGLLAFVIVFIVQALGHTVMIAMENIFGEAYVYQSAFALGAAGRGPALHRHAAPRRSGRHLVRLLGRHPALDRLGRIRLRLERQLPGRARPDGPAHGRRRSPPRPSTW